MVLAGIGIGQVHGEGDEGFGLMPDVVTPVDVEDKADQVIGGVDAGAFAFVAVALAGSPIVAGALAGPAFEVLSLAAGGDAVALLVKVLDEGGKAAGDEALVGGVEPAAGLVEDVFLVEVEF
jgi:hypothetical protein